MAKHPSNPLPEDPYDPLHMPIEPLDDIEEVVEFVDEDVLEPIEVGFEDDSDFVVPQAEIPKATLSKAGTPQANVPLAMPIRKPIDAGETDSVLDDELLRGGKGPGLDSATVSGVFSSVIRAEPISDVLGYSEVIRAEPLSESVALDPLSNIAAMKADSDIRADIIAPRAEPVEYDEVDLIDEAVLDDEMPHLVTSEISLPESAVREEALLADDEDAVGDALIAGIDDSSVSLKSFKGQRHAPEKEPVLDLDDTMAGLDSPHPKRLQSLEKTVVFDGGASDDVEIDDLVVEVEVDDGSAVNLGQKPTRKPGQSGIDPVAEELESGVRLDGGEAATVQRASSPPSVEFDELIVDDDTLRPLPQGAKLGESSFDDVPAVVDEVADIDDFGAAQPVADDDIDINAILGDDATEVGAAIDDEIRAVVDEAPIDVDDAPPVTTPKRGKRAAVSAGIDAAPAPYQEPKKRGWGSLLGGVVLGGLLTAGAAAGVWFGAPDLIPSPTNSVKAPGNLDGKISAKSPLQMALEEINQGKYADAHERLKDEKDADKAILEARGDAAWLAYLQKQTSEKLPLSADDAAVKSAMADLSKAENPLKLQQLQLALESNVLKTEIEQAKKNEESLKDDLKKAAADKVEAEKKVVGMAKVFTDAKVLAEGDKLDAAALQKIAKDLGETKSALTAVNKALDDAKVDAGEKGVEKLATAKKDFEDKLAAVNKLLEGAKVKDPGAKGLTEVLANRDKLAKEQEELDLTIKAAFQELVEGKLVPADGDPRKDLVAGAKAARTKSESPLGGPLSSLANSLGSVTFGVGDLVKNAFGGVATAGELNFYRVRESFVPSPEQQLDRLTAAFANHSQKDAALIADANRLAEWVASNDAKFSPAAKAKALYVVGLSQRNQEKYADARKSLQAAAESAKGIDASWAVGIQNSLAEISEPNAYFIPRIEKLRAAKDFGGALAELAAALAVIPDHPRLKAERGLIALEQTTGAVEPKDRETIRVEAQNAAKDPKSAASGNFVLGRLEEQSGNLPKAEEFYRQALKAVSDEGEQSAQIRLNLGRLLLKDRAASPAPPAAPKKDEKKEEKEAEKDVGDVPGPKVSFIHPLDALAAAAVLGQVPAIEDDDSPEVQARLKEAVELAGKLIESKDKKIQAQGHFLMGDALSRQGQRTEGLRQYAKGIEILIPDAQVSKLLDEHPAFSVPDAQQRANPLLAEKHYGVGLHLYHQRKFAEAETQFRQAISYFDKDARYYYFLGLSQLEQGTKTKRDASIFAWEQASRLEANSRPTSREINLTLERIQGDRRFLLNAFRAKATGMP